MGEAIQTAVIELAVKKLVSGGYQEIMSAVHLEPEVTRLRESRTIIQAALLDADSVLEHSHVQQDMLEKLSCELSRLVDFLDARKTKAKNKANLLKEACLFFSASNQLVARFRDTQTVKYIRKNLDSIARDYAQFGSVLSAHQTQAGIIQTAGYLCPLGRLPHLKDLFLEGLDNVEYIEKYTSSSNINDNNSLINEAAPESLFPSLERFRLKGLPKLQGWWKMSGDPDVQHQNRLTERRPAFPKLKALTADTIELAITIANGPGFASLENLYILEKLTVNVPHCQRQTRIPLNTCFPNLRCLQLSGNPEIEVLPEEFRHLSSLEYLRINNCKQLKAIPEWIDRLSSLTSLCIWECPRLESLPRQISNLSKLKLLGISKCSKVLTEKCRCKDPTGEYWPYIQHIPYINIRLSSSVDDA
ncbi:hypothetical protein SOVF_037860 [Spinacia oleracea]|nr:hypothetical protein SOVF_037860 [Spinacia oleracea]